MTDNNEDVIDLTCSFTLADHFGLNNVVIDLDTEESFREEINHERKRASNATRKRRRVIKPRVRNTATPVQNTATPVQPLISEEKVDKKGNRKSKKIHEKSPEEPQEKKARGLGSCPICMEELDTKPMSATKCGHVFCTACIKSALKNTPTCPQCRAKLKGATAFHPLFL